MNVSDTRQSSFEAVAIEIGEQARRATTRHAIEAARAKLVDERAGADAARALSARARHHRRARARGELQRDVRAAQRRLAQSTLDGGVRGIPARHASDCGTRCSRSLRSACSAWRASELTRADAARAVPRAGVRRVFPGDAHGGVDSAAGARDGDRSARRRPHRARHGRARREAFARVLLAGARAGRGVSRAAAARRPDRLDDVPARARPRAALRVHAAATSRSSIAGSATTRSPKATRCCSTTA